MMVPLEVPVPARVDSQAGKGSRRSLAAAVAAVVLERPLPIRPQARHQAAHQELWHTSLLAGR